MKTTFKDYVVEQLVEMGIEDHEGNVYESQAIFDRFDEFVKELEQKELAEIVIDFTEL